MIGQNFKVTFLERHCLLTSKACCPNLGKHDLGRSGSSLAAGRVGNTSGLVLRYFRLRYSACLAGSVVLNCVSKNLGALKT